MFASHVRIVGFSGKHRVTTVLMAALGFLPCCGSSEANDGLQEKAAVALKVPMRAAMDPPRSKYTDVGIGERVDFEIRVIPGPGWDPSEISDPITTCNCLFAEWLNEPTPEGGRIHAWIEYGENEDIEGGILLEDRQRRIVAQHFSEIKIYSRVYAMPRKVVLDRDTGLIFTITVGIAWPEAQMTKELEIDELGDSEVLSVQDFKPRPDFFENRFRRQAFDVIYQLSGSFGSLLDGDIDQGRTEKTVLKLKTGQPLAEFEIPVEIHY